MTEPTCPECGSIDVCQDWLVRNRGKYGWTCDHCEHEWDIEEGAPES
jgi:transposase-like protein